MPNAKDANVSLDRDVFLRTLVRELSGTLGSAKVELRETIAEGHPGCHVVVHLRRTPTAEAVDGREYFKGEEVK